jgi:protein O-mannosyl-transferase
MKRFEFARHRPSLVISLVLGLMTFLLYLPIVRNGFVNYDDQGYITGNAHVSQGLSWPGIVWAFKSDDLANWHPLTWISHMADCQWFGLNPAGHHFTNILLHTANTLLLFFLLRQMTSQVWPSAFVAAFFGWHPLHVESVAWASERKDVLSAFFWLLTMMVYVKYVRKPGVFIYLLALVLFACALMSKPMAVTLPFVLLLMDFWPLNRLAPTSQNTAANLPNQKPGGYWRTIVFLVGEKLPFFALSLADCYITFLAQKNGGAVLSVSALPFSYRLANALWSYLRYISSSLCPTGLCVIYPYKVHLPVVLVTISILLLIIWSVLFLLWRKKFPYLLVGWLWFLGTLVPTIGLVQVGAQSMADRYMYIPSIGLFILIIWSVSDLIRFRPPLRIFCLFVGTAALALCLIATSVQINYWRNTITLFTHAIKVTGDNSVAYCCLGLGYEKAGDKSDAMALYVKSLKIEPNYLPVQYAIGRMLLDNGDYLAAKSHFDYAEEIKPDSAQTHWFLAYTLEKMTNTDGALLEFSNALSLQPDYSDARYGLAVALTTAGRTNDALAQYRAEVKFHSDDPESYYNLGLALLDNRQFADAEKEFTLELRLAPAELRAHYRLAQALAGEHKFAEAAAQYRAALQILPNFPDATKELNTLLAAHPELK